ncbi:hypothetical protein [Geomicrobium sp. JCM 19039]|uniref:hypothetical protein n=1 Tax=Geomicrobium sp. JCM 19039 TaxID=1460636 RepID=UPI00045F3B50|nr:hypothetical protein [Geomicrobium sp. JCM 19039]GAK12223.1 hypothetical protein JCM19039_1973 [Geomicrobium sp. JCM 19039]
MSDRLEDIKKEFEVMKCRSTTLLTYTDKFERDLEFLIEQAEKVERYEESLRYISGEWERFLKADTLEDAEDSARGALEGLE